MAKAIPHPLMLQIKRGDITISDTSLQPFIIDKLSKNLSSLGFSDAQFYLLT